MVRKKGKRWVVETYDPGTQKKAHRGSYATKREAKDAEAKFRMERRQRGSQAPSVDVYAERWVETHPREKRSTSEQYEKKILLVAQDFRGRAMDSISRVEAREYALRHRGRAKLASAMFSDAIRDDLVEQNPFLGLRLPEGRGRKDLVVPTETEIDALVRAAGERWGDYGRRVYGPMIEVAAFTGLRPGELYGLRWSDVDFPNDLLTVERQFNSKTKRFDSPKTRAGRRTIALHSRAAAALGRIPQVREEVWTTVTGKMFWDGVAVHYWDPVKALAGMPDLAFYSLRHFFGTLLARLGVGPVEIAAMMGHDDGGKLAMNRYVHLTLRDAQVRVAAAFERDQVRELRPVREDTL